jgi:hypothetical protein
VPRTRPCVAYDCLPEYPVSAENSIGLWRTASRRAAGDQLRERRADGEIVAYHAGASKGYWDDLFRAVGAQVNGFGVINLIAWFALVAGGGRAWNKHRRPGRLPG